MTVIDQFRLDDRVAFVTGGGRGLGRAIAQAMGEAGAKVGIIDIDSDVAEQAASEMKGEGLSAVGISADVTKVEDVEAAVVTVTREFGVSPNVLVNNAGIVRAAMISKMTMEQWNEVLAVHCTGAFNCLRAVLDGMKTQGFGRMITLTSSAGLAGTIGQINYGTAKGGLVGFTFSAAKELARYNILCNAIAPVANTRMTETVRNNEAWYNKYVEAIPLHRWAEPEEVAPAAVYLASPAANFITGHILPVDGGQLMR